MEFCEIRYAKKIIAKGKVDLELATSLGGDVEYFKRHIRKWEKHLEGLEES